MNHLNQNNQKGFANIIAVVVILAFIVAGYLLVKSNKIVPTESVQIVDTANWKTYQNPIHNYSLQYPQSNYTVDDSDPSGEGYAPNGKFGNFLSKDIGLPTYKEVFAVNVLTTPEWTTIGSEAVALKNGFKKGGTEEIARLSREINLSKEKYFPNKKVSNVKEFFFSNGSGYGFTVTGTFSFGFDLARKDGIEVGGKVIEGERVFVYVTDGKNIYSVEFPNKPLENKIFSTFKFTESTTKTDTLNWKTYKNAEYRIEFKYPLDWKVNPQLYRTPAQEVNREKSSIVGYSIISLNPKLFNEGYIEIGGRQFDCWAQGAFQTRCVTTKEVGDVHTESNDPQVLKIFDLFIQQFTVIKDYEMN